LPGAGRVGAGLGKLAVGRRPGPAPGARLPRGRRLDAPREPPRAALLRAPPAAPRGKADANNWWRRGRRAPLPTRSNRRTTPQNVVIHVASAARRPARAVPAPVRGSACQYGRVTSVTWIFSSNHNVTKRTKRSWTCEHAAIPNNELVPQSSAERKGPRRALRDSWLNELKRKTAGPERASRL